MLPGSQDLQQQGAYVLYLDVQRPLTLWAGAVLKAIFLPAGHYVYVGSARRGIAGRIARHRRLAEQKAGNLHWHIDYLLAHPRIQLTGDAALGGCLECDVSRQIAARRGVSAPIPNFGSTDCRSGCKAHLYRLGTGKKRCIRIALN
jgi:Uri superfamily endonuclease